MNLLIMGQNYHLIHHLWPSIPWFEYKIAYEKTKPLLDMKGSPQRVGIFESKQDIDRQNGIDLVEKVNRFAEIFWATKDVQTETKKSLNPPHIDIIVPVLSD